MRVLVTGATGVVGRQLTPMLVSAGHEVSALTRSTSAASLATRLGARPVAGNLFEMSDVSRAFRTVQPEAVVHMATAIPGTINPRRLASDFELTNRLRTEGTRNLIAASEGHGTVRFVAQGLAYAYDPTDREPATEDAPLWQNPPRQFQPVLDALQSLERQVSAVRGVTLRFGHLYGPGSIYSPSGSFYNQVRAGKVPLVGGGTSVFSFTHALDAATAVLAALDRDVSGPLNVVDDQPTPLATWLPEYARALGAPTPKTAPAALARLAVGGWGVAFMTLLRGADNARAKSILRWKPHFPAAQTGLLEEIGGMRSAPTR